MRTFLRTLALVGVCLILVLWVLSITGFGPHGRTPGLWLKGNAVTTPVADWSFTNNIPVVQLQTESWYRLPHSVNINCLNYNSQLYLVSVYPAGTKHTWNDNVLRDPRVRLKIHNSIYDRTLMLVTDPAVQQGVLEARHAKYPQLKIPPNSTVHVFQVEG